MTPPAIRTWYCLSSPPPGTNVACSPDMLSASQDSASLLSTLRRRRKASMFNTEDAVIMTSIDESSDPTAVAIEQLVRWKGMERLRTPACWALSCFSCQVLSYPVIAILGRHTLSYLVTLRRQRRRQWCGPRATPPWTNCAIRLPPGKWGTRTARPTYCLLPEVDRHLSALARM